MLLFALALPRGTRDVGGGCRHTRRNALGLVRADGSGGEQSFLVGVDFVGEGLPRKGRFTGQYAVELVVAALGLASPQYRALPVRQRTENTALYATFTSGKTDLADGQQPGLSFFFAVVLSPVSAPVSDYRTTLACQAVFRQLRLHRLRSLAHGLARSARFACWDRRTSDDRIGGCIASRVCAAWRTVPQQAVEAGHSWALISWYGIGAPVAAFAVPFVLASIPGLDRLNLPLLVSALEMLFFIPLLVLAYWGLHYLIAIPFFNRLFTLDHPDALVATLSGTDHSPDRVDAHFRSGLLDSRVSEEPGSIRSAPVLLSKKE